MTTVQSYVLSYIKRWHVRKPETAFIASYYGWVAFENANDAANCNDSKRRRRGAIYNINPRTMKCLERDGFIKIEGDSVDLLEKS